MLTTNQFSKFECDTSMVQLSANFQLESKLTRFELLRW